MSRTVPTREGGREAILRAIWKHYFLSVEQVTRLLYSPGSLVWVRGVLRTLAKEGYLQRKVLATTSKGEKPHIYFLGRRGVNVLKQLGISTFPKASPSDVASLSSDLFLPHNQVLNDVLVAMCLLPRLVPEVRLAEWQHDWLLKRSPVRVKTKQDGTISVVPDAWLDFHLHGRTRMSIILEVDRGTEDRSDFKRKLRALLAYTAGPYQAAFGTEAVTVAFATTKGRHRVELMRGWCQQVLTDGGQKEAADVFLFTALPDGGAPDPRTLCLSPIWHSPFSADLVPLLTL